MLVNKPLLNFDFKKINTFSQVGEAYTEFLISSDIEIISDPIWIKNHTTNEYDFVFQDIENVLHYYSNKGNLIWRRNLSSKIIGDIKKLKLKIQIKIQGEELRVDGKKRDDLQDAIAAIKTIDIGLPIEFINFRD